MFRSVLAAGLAFALSTAAANAQSFTYQGELKSAGSPVTGTFDFDLRIFNAASGGIQIGATASVNAVSVVDGRFTVPVNILDSAVAAAGQYVQISVRPTGSPTGFVTLNPRTEITPTPLALRSLNERWSTYIPGVLKTDAGVERLYINTTNGIIPDSVMTVSRNTTPGNPFGGMYVNGTDPSSNVYYGWATNGASKAEALVSGLTGNFSLFVGEGTALQVTPTGNVAIGTAPISTARLLVNGAVNMTADAKAASFSYQNVQNRVISIPPEALKPIITSQDGFMGSGNGFAFLDATITSGTISSPVYLPDNATITGFEAVYLDNSAAANLDFTLFKRVMTANGYGIVASLSSSGSSATNTTTVATGVTPEVVNNETTCYMVTCFSTDWQGSVMAVKGLRVRYTVPGPQ
jgi:hypothetical protein